MINLDEHTVQLNVKAENKEDAIRKVGNLLVQSDHIQSGYIESMLAREDVANTYLGHGIAIPHGMPKNRELINRTGIAVMQVPGGVQWNPGEDVFLVVGIAARSDEHIEILSNLTNVLDDEQTIKRLSLTDDPGDIIAVLTGSKKDAAGGVSKPALEDFPKFVDITVQGSHGLHARPATTFVELAKKFQARVHVRYGEKIANGKSLVSILKLGVEKSGELHIMAQGPDEDEALKILQEAIKKGLGEEEEAAVTAEDTGIAHGWIPSLPGRIIRGLTASPGLAIGPVCHYTHRKIIVEATARDPLHEKKRLKQAMASARVELEGLYHEVREKSGESKASIFKAHAEFLDDPDLIDETNRVVDQGYSAGWSWQKTIRERVLSIEKTGQALFAARAADLNDVGNRVLRLISGDVEDEPFHPEEPVILLSEDLAPSDTAKLDPAFIMGFCTSAGGPTSHTSIIARSLDIPAMVSAGPAVMNLADGEIGVLDGDTGSLYLDLGEVDLASARQARQDRQGMRAIEYRTRYEPALTTDGYRIEVAANIGAAKEARQAVDAGGEGVGLLRTEFLFLKRNDPPTEEEQYGAYTEMVGALNGLPLIIRTLDIGGDKEVPYLNMPAESNPFLGVRGIRLCFANPELFRTQLRAIFRASMKGPVKIMFPMIATLEDLEQAKEVTENVRKEVGAKPVDIGIMIEVPSAVIMAKELAKKVDFFSIGTNDLTQYVLAMDRLHPSLAAQADGLHPAVLRFVHQTVQAADEAGIWVGVCGGIAGDPKGAILLAGLGVKELSMSIPSIAAVKAKLRGISMADARDVAIKAISCRNVNEVRALKYP
jgi:multiphosphoryl transfer protein